MHACAYVFVQSIVLLLHLPIIYFSHQFMEKINAFIFLLPLMKALLEWVQNYKMLNVYMVEVALPEVGVS